jgi:NADH-quinone oxidoreductase subunit L
VHTELLIWIPGAPLIGAMIAGLLGSVIGRAGAHAVTILGVGLSFCLSVIIGLDVWAGHSYNAMIYPWLSSGGLHLGIGFQVDPLTVVMMLVVTFVSLMVHIYTIGYMAHDEENWPQVNGRLSLAGQNSYQRFFAYISLFTFSMLMLVMSNNFVQLFFGWEAVGLVSYLLIGFWSVRPSAVYANLKAFLVNRVGDFGFLIGIGLIAAHAGSLDYQAVFAQAPALAGMTETVTGWPLISAICIALFIGAMGKSAQFPLHVWLPDSMEGPTPISALIHAATMVTAGIFMVSRMSPLFEHSPLALSFIMIIGAITALFMAFIAVVQTDIKRVVAYSTLSQLGYMTVALGASAYSAAIFHLMTHAFFKAVLFLGAGSVIIAMHHEQDMRKMGGLRKLMPITYLTVLIGALANAGLPPFSGFFSKDAIIEAVHHANLPGAGFAYACLLAGVFVGGLYSFRLVFLTFHGRERFNDTHGHGDPHAQGHGHAHRPHESPWVVTLPLILLALPAIASGWLIGPLLQGSWFGDAIVVSPAHPAMAQLQASFHGVIPMIIHGLTSLPFALALSGALLAGFLYIVQPQLPGHCRRLFSPVVTILERKYGLDDFNEWCFAGGARLLGRGLWKAGDETLIDGIAVNGSAATVGLLASWTRQLQTGHLYQYAFFMIFGVFVLLTLWFNRL